MEEKERYIIDKSTNYYTNTIVDTKTNTYYGNIEEHIDLLNKQNKENQQLKQQLHDLPNKIVAEVEKNFTEYLPLKDKTGAGFYSRLNSILKKYEVEDEN